MSNFSMNRTLNTLNRGQKGLITKVENIGLFRRRILDMGFTPGTQVECVRKSPSGNPVAYRVKGAVIALRKEDASLIKICI